MLKPVAAGLMCLGFVTLGVAISQGQDDETDLIVIEGKVGATEVTPDAAKQQPGNGVSFTTGGGKTGQEAPGAGEAVELTVADPDTGKLVQVFRLKQLPATATAAGLRSLLTRARGNAPKIEADDQGQRLLIHGTVNQMSLIKKLLTYLDDDTPNPNSRHHRFEVSHSGDIIVSNEDGKIVERLDAGATPARGSARFTRLAQAQQVVDAQTRESLEKMTTALKEQIQKLQSEGKQDEAQQKARSVGAIEALLNGNPRVINLMRRSPAPQQSMEEIRKLHERLKDLQEERAKLLNVDLSKLPEDAAERVKNKKIEQEMIRIEQEIAEKHQALNGPNQFSGQTIRFAPGGQPMAPGMQQQFHGTGIGFLAAQQQGVGPSAGMTLLRKSEALSQAANQLKSSGLDEQAQHLQAQAEKLRAEGHKMIQEEAAKRREQGAAQRGFGAGGGDYVFGAFPGGPPMELHRSIHELQEQIQQLRKEVGELRELLQRKQ